MGDLCEEFICFGVIFKDGRAFGVEQIPQRVNDCGKHHGKFAGLRQAPRHHEQLGDDLGRNIFKFLLFYWINWV